MVRWDGGRFCQVATASRSGDDWHMRVLGGVTGGFLVIAAASLVWHLRDVSNRKRLREQMLKVLGNEVILAVNVAFEIWDFGTDSYMFYTVLKRAYTPQSDVPRVLVGTWIVAFAVSCAVSLACLFLKLKLYVRMVRARREEFDVVSQFAPCAHTRKHQQRLEAVQKDITLVYTSVMLGLLEDLPLGTLGLVYLYSHHDNVMQYISTASSWLMLGVKICQLPRLRNLWQYKSKQTTKVSLVVGTQSTAGDVEALLQSHEELRDWVANFHGVTGAEFVKLDSDEQLRGLGIDVESVRALLVYIIRRSRTHGKERRRAEAAGTLGAGVSTETDGSPAMLFSSKSFELLPVVHPP